MSIYKYSDDEIVVEVVDEEETREAVAIALDEHLPAALRPGSRRPTEGGGGFACNRQLPAAQSVQERLSPPVPPRLGHLGLPPAPRVPRPTRPRRGAAFR